MRTISLLIIVSFNGFAQSETVPTRLVRVEYSNGFSTFSICISNPQIQAKDDLTYYWYTKESGVQNTKGSFSGNLLHGKFQFFNKNGKLKDEKEIKNGLQDGNSMSWNDVGKMTVKTHYVGGKCDYMKESFSSEDYSIEWSMNKNYKAEENLTDVVQGVGDDCLCVGKPGCIKNTYSQGTDKLVQRMEWLNDFITKTSEYYESNGKVKKESVYFPDFSETKEGIYKEFYPDGKIRLQGKLIHDETRHGEFKYYRNDGTIEKTEVYQNNQLIKVK